MKTIKKNALAVFPAFIALSIGAFANEPEIYPGGFTLGASINASASTTTPFLTFGYIGNRCLFDMGFSYTDIARSNGNHRNRFNFMSRLGLRNRLFTNLYITYGATGSVAAGNPQGNSRPYSAGAFVGLDLQVARHFLISCKINPYNFERSGSNVRSNEVFSSGSIDLSYVF